MAWVVLVVKLPTHPSSLRVRAWRRLKALGAVALKNSVWVLPWSPEAYEHFQWLAQEVQHDRGEATLLKVDRIENMDHAAVVRLFNTARDADYTALAERYRAALRVLEKPSGRRPPSRVAEDVARARRELARLREIDFFDAPAGRDAERLREAVEQRLQPSRPAGAPATAASLDALRGRRWVTRPRPHVDRIASAWLIKRFVDPEAEFVFAAPDEAPADAIPFDMVGAEFGHHGEHCTFETLLARSGLREPRLRRLAEVVHEADLRDGRFDCPEARGVDLAVRGLLAIEKDDHAVLAEGLRLFDALHAGAGPKGDS